MNTIASRIYYFSNLNEISQEITLNSADSHHLSNVLRLKNGDNIALFNSINGEWLAKITNNHKNHTKLILLEQIKPSNIVTSKVHLMYAPLKNTASSFLLEKITEVGVYEITQIITSRTTNKAVDLDKITLKVKQATEQCGRLELPLVNPSISLLKMLSNLSATNQLIWLNEQQSGDDLITTLSKAPKSISLLIGPEGGFSAEEISLLKSHPHVIASYLKGNILKAETAAVISVAMAVYINS